MTTGAGSSRKKEIIALFVVPIVMTLFVAAVLVVPGLFTSPKYDFLYEQCDSYCFSSTYVVVNGELMRNEADTRFSYPDETATLYRYDIETGQSETVTVEEFASAQLDSSTTAPDGFKLQRGGGSGGSFFPLLFFGGSYDFNKWYLVKDNIQEEVKPEDSGNEMNFVSWVIDD